MNKRTKAPTRLSNRARHCLVYLLSNFHLMAGHPSILEDRLVELDSYSPEHLKRLLLKVTKQPPHVGRPLKQVLLMQKNCGFQTALEIMTWIGIANGCEQHRFVCRHCGATQ